MIKNIIIIILFLFSITLLGYIGYDKILIQENNIIDSSEEIDGLLDNNNNNNNDDDLNEKNEVNNDIEDDIEMTDDNVNNNKEEINNDNDNLNSNQNMDKVDNIKFDKYEEIIETQLLKMLGFNSLSETSNQDRLAIVFELYNNKYNWKEKISISDLEQVKRDSAIRNVKVEYTNLLDYSMSINYESSPFYQKKDGIYVYSNTGHSENDASIIYKELINSKIDNNEIQLSYKFIFARTHIKTSSTTPGYHSLYYDLKEEPFEEFSFLSLREEAGKDIAYDRAKTYIVENYETIKDNLYTYNFVFINEGGNIILKDYYRE